MIKVIKMNKMFLLLVLFVFLVFSCSSDPDGDKTKHVLVIGIDGALARAVQTANTPNLNFLIANGAYTWNAYSGGEIDTETQQATSSGPAWSSILTGVWVNKHGVADNSFTEPNYFDYPHFFRRIREKCPEAFLSSIVNWKPINEKILSDADYQATGNDEEVAKLAVKHILSEDPRVLFLQFDEVDGAGHQFGYDAGNPDYLAAISVVDKQIGMVLVAISKRPKADSEDWLTIVTADHGGKEKSHGGQSPEERTVFFIVCGGEVVKGEIDSGPGIVAVPPTALKHLGIEIEPSWGWETEPFGYQK